MFGERINVQIVVKPNQYSTYSLEVTHIHYPSSVQSTLIYTPYNISTIVFVEKKIGYFKNYKSNT